MFKQIRIGLATIFGVIITLLFLDFTGTIHAWFGWMAKIQLVPAVLALNVGVIVALVLLTLIFGRLYCSVICPLGIFQDVVSKLNFTKKKNKKFSYSPAKSLLRYGFLALFVILLVAGFSSIAGFIAPYSAFGRMASNLLAPIYGFGNNLLAYIAERTDSYAFYQHEIWIKSVSTFVVSIITFVVISFLAWRHGREYCNTVCPVGTVLGFISKFSLLKIQIDTEKCNSCGLCGFNCKSSCIDTKAKEIDYSRCVTCFNCLEKCNRGALTYAFRATSKAESKKEERVDDGRRKMLTITGAMLATTAIKAQEAKVDGGLAYIEDKKIPARQTPIVPAGSLSIRNFTSHCTGCQLCVSVCPNGVLRPSSSLDSFMQPEMSYEKGYCRPECTKCSEVCPVGAINLISREDKSSTQIGHAVWIEKNCVVLTDDVSCGNCARHCPTGAITMVPIDAENPNSKQIPSIDKERCIGCGACENLCPSRPFSSIYVEGHKVHRTI